MKTKLHSIFLLLIAFAVTRINGQTIPNSGFENWTLIAGQFMSPDNWKNNASDMSIAVEEESPGYSGNHALRLNTSGYARSKFPFSQHPTNITTYVKSAFSMVDTVKIKVLVYSGNNIVDMGYWINTISISNWSLISIPVSVSLSSVDSLEILISCGNKTGTSIHIDELSYSLANGIKESYPNVNANIFPNPFSKQATLQTNIFLNNATLLFDNIYGETVKQIKNISGQTITLLRENLPSGLYSIRLIQDDKMITMKKMLITD